MPTDEQLAALLKSDDLAERETGYSALVREYLPFLIELGKMYHANEDDVQDCVTELFAALPRHLDHYRAGTPLRAFITQLFQNRLQSVVRNRSILEVPFEDLPAPTEQKPAPKQPKFGEHTFAELLNFLSPLQKEIVTAHYVEEATAEEISAAMYLPHSTVLSHLSHAKKLLRDRILKSDGGGTEQPAR